MYVSLKLLTILQTYTSTEAVFTVIKVLHSMWTTSIL